jgi:hypothetical protein
MSTPYEQLGGKTPNGVTIGSATTDLISVYGVAPVVQASAITSGGTTVAVSTSHWGFATSTMANAISVSVDSIITALKNFGITA